MPQRAQRWLGSHAVVYGLAAVGLLLVDLLVPVGWWLFWPLLVWGLLLAAHYLFVRSSRVDDRWADRRATELADKAYDFSHIESIRDRYAGPAASRRRREQAVRRDGAERPRRSDSEPE